jgi:predicted ATP-dependent serine protease
MGKVILIGGSPMIGKSTEKNLLKQRLIKSSFYQNASIYEMLNMAL